MIHTQWGRRLMLAGKRVRGGGGGVHTSSLLLGVCVVQDGCCDGSPTY